MYFLQSIWLLAIAGIIVPIVIHLWNVRSGKVLKVGSIALLSERSRAHATSFKLSDLLLLILRCLILIALALLLAKPYYLQQTRQTAEKGWLLIERQHIGRAYTIYGSTIDSLINAGFTFRYFEPGFQKADWEQVKQAVNDTGLRSILNYWGLVKSLDQLAPERLPIYLFTTNRLQHFSGARPVVAMNLNWRVYSTLDTIQTSIVDAFRTAANRLKVIQETSSSKAISYLAVDTASYVKAIHQGNEGQPYLITQTGDSIPVATSKLKVVIYSGKQVNDGRYVNAALRAIQDFTERPISIAFTTQKNGVPAGDWLFWLSDEALPSTSHKHIFVYAGGKPLAQYSTGIIPMGLPIAANLYQQVNAPETLQHNAVVLWKDGFGRPLLTSEQGQSTVYRYYSRFDPAWNDLAWSSQFPELLYRLMFNHAEAEFTGTDLRSIDPLQIAPVTKPANVAAAKPELAEKKDLSRWFWLLAFLLFIAERWVSLHNKKGVVNA
ncbi:hypothetical protein EXU57_07590 [Segetibacter sp. 3557_3]|uniref:BatA domain-containing protein n=1 Tax=Segetibacter sp. 3557_3 TaxID=2547429 RepID=UPI0010584C1D|nr:BatA domain-containing protein [Segetibacter sp. 3557_3]TDH27438.1 hypothetical protein EXU57_07590 [Segetibacter sp. 3557_3]